MDISNKSGLWFLLFYVYILASCDDLDNTINDIFGNDEDCSEATTTTTKIPETNKNVCVAKYLCNKDGFVVEDGEGLLNPRLKEGCKNCQEDDVCCSLRNTGPDNDHAEDCICVSEDLCLNGFINDDGSGILSKRSGKKDCSRGEICCRPKDDSIITTTTSTTSQISNQPEGCACVSKNLCVNGVIVDDGSGILNPRLKNNCNDEPDTVCCRPPDSFTTTSITTITTVIPATTTITTAKPDTTIITTVKPDTTTKPIFHGCGIRNVKGVEFKTTNKTKETMFGEFPWTVAIFRVTTVESKNVQDVFICGGSLVHPKAVITAAHCVRDMLKKFQIRAGVWDITTENKKYPTQTRNVASVTIHPHFYNASLLNDIAFLVLADAISFKKNVGIICLPPKGTTLANIKCFSAGWGKDNFNNGKYHNILKKIDLTIVDRNSCQNKLRQSRLGPLYKLHRGFLCAGGEIGKDTCKGDGGGPLICPIPSKTEVYYQIGIISWGIGCGNVIPGVYVDIAYYRDWIDQQMDQNNLEKSFYQY